MNPKLLLHQTPNSLQAKIDGTIQEINHQIAEEHAALYQKKYAKIILKKNKEDNYDLLEDVLDSDPSHFPYYADARTNYSSGYSLGSVTSPPSGYYLGSVTAIDTTVTTALAAGGMSTFSIVGIGTLALGGGITIVALSSGGNDPAAPDTISPTFTSYSSANVLENSTIFVYDATADGDINVLYTLKGIDSNLFNINSSTGVINFISPPDYENPLDADSDNIYSFTVMATDYAGNTADQALRISVTDIVEVISTIVIADPMELFNTDIWSKSDGWSNSGVFANSWSADQIFFDQSLMNIKLTTIDSILVSGEYRSIDSYGYGLYETSLKASGTVGTINGFFTYTGPSEGTDHHEIDIEIKGDNSSQVQVNYWTDGIEHPTLIDLGFDASLAFHTYAFLWQENQIGWYIDNRLIHTEDGSKGLLPTLPGKIMTNLWATVGAGEWSSDYASSSGSALLQIDSIHYTSYQTTNVI